MKNCILFLSLLLIPFTPLFSATHAVTAKHVMVVSEQQLASDIGAKILAQGGNAIDAAVAVGYALAVVNPCCGNIGGGGFMTIHLANGKNIVLNFREQAPGKASADMYSKTNDLAGSTQGYLAVAVPGTVLGLETARTRYGTMTRQQLMQPAIDLAENGYPVTAYDAKLFQRFASAFRQQPNVAAIFLKNGQPLMTGEHLVQADLARTLQLIAAQGPDAFYQGSIAKAIVAASQRNGGILSMADFAHYRVEELTPLSCDYRGYTLITVPPPSSGGVILCEMLNILVPFSLYDARHGSINSVQTIIETMRYGFRDRNSALGDPHFVHDPIKHLLSRDYAAQLSQRILTTYTNPSSIVNDALPELTDTTHYSVIDHQGNAVAVTYTINGFFGAGVIADGTGFFLNNEMNDFSIGANVANKFGLVQSDANAIAPYKQPLSSMTPTIVMKNGHVFMVIGSPGGPRIITAVLLTLLNVIDFQMDLQSAVNTPRYHYQGIPDVVNLEPLALPFLTSQLLVIKGYPLITQDGWGAVEAIQVLDNGMLYGVNDRRRPDGGAAGY